MLEPNLRNCDFTEANLAYADFSGAQIQGCVFWGANLCNADFTKADFGTGANFVGAGPWYFTAPGYNGWSGEKDYTAMSIEDQENSNVYWVLANEAGLGNLGYVAHKDILIHFITLNGKVTVLHFILMMKQKHNHVLFFTIQKLQMKEF